MSNYAKLKTNLKLAIQRLKLLEKKKTEQSLKGRKEIADYISINKPDRAKIRVEHIIREDNMVEGLEIIEMFCDLLLARFGLIEKMKELDPGLDEAIGTILWVSPRISNDVQEFKLISDILTSKYGTPYAESCRADRIGNVNEKVKRRMGIEPPSKLLIEQYLIEIAKNFNVNYIPDPSLFLTPSITNDLIKFDDYKGGSNNNGGGAGGFSGSSGGGGFDKSEYAAAAASVPSAPVIGFEPLSNKVDGSFTYPSIPPPLPKNLPYDSNDDNTDSLPPRYVDYSGQPEYFEDKKKAYMGPEIQADGTPLPYKQGAPTNAADQFHFSPPPTYQEKATPKGPSAPFSAKVGRNAFLDDLPSVPDDAPTGDVDANRNDDNNDLNFDDLSKRFENLKKF